MGKGFFRLNKDMEHSLRELDEGKEGGGGRKKTISSESDMGRSERTKRRNREWKWV